jgi:hypothetical protein
MSREIAQIDSANVRSPRARLIVLDDIGLVPLSPDTAEGFFRLGCRL